MNKSHNCKEMMDAGAEVGIVYYLDTKRWEFYHPQRREPIYYCPYCGDKLMKLKNVKNLADRIYKRMRTDLMYQEELVDDDIRWCVDEILELIDEAIE